MHNRNNRARALAAGDRRTVREPLRGRRARPEHRVGTAVRRAAVPAPRDAAVNLATKIMAPFTVATRRRRDGQADRRVARGAGVPEPLQAPARRRRDLRQHGRQPRRRRALRRAAARHDGRQGRRAEPQGDGVRPDEPRQQPRLRLGRRGHVLDDRAARHGRDRPCRHRQEPRRRAGARRTSTARRAASAWSACTRRNSANGPSSGATYQVGNIGGRPGHERAEPTRSSTT